MNLIKSITSLFSYQEPIALQTLPTKVPQVPPIPPTDIEDIHKYVHIDKEYKNNSIFNGLLESIAEEFKNNIDSFKTTNDIDKFKKNIQKL